MVSESEDRKMNYKRLVYEIINTILVKLMAGFLK